jgi:hypothetical protein
VSGWRTDEMVEESNSRAKKNSCDVDGELVEEASIQQLLDGVSAVDADRLPAGGGFGLLDIARSFRGWRLRVT